MHRHPRELRRVLRRLRQQRIALKTMSEVKRVLPVFVAFIMESTSSDSTWSQESWTQQAPGFILFFFSKNNRMLPYFRSFFGVISPMGWRCLSFSFARAFDGIEYIRTKLSVSPNEHR